MTKLSAAALDELAERLPVPRYDRTQLRGGIVHLGVGAFHRAHQARYLHELMNDGKALDCAITGIGFLPQDRHAQEALRGQDHLYTLIVKHADGSIDPQVVGSIIDYLYAPDDPEAVLSLMASPSTRIVSLTITEGGYHLNEATGDFDAGDPEIAAELEPDAEPSSAFGYIVEALARRRAAGTPPFTIMSCDNIQGNGDVARKTIGGFAKLRDPALADWLAEEVSFPNSMVDRITPGTTDADRTLLRERLGIEDAWPVVCEPFSQWVLEDAFTSGRPPLEDVGVQLVTDVEPYELMKLRLLNVSHQTMCYLGYLSGHHHVHDACADPLFVQLLQSYMDLEATPTLAPVPGIDLEDYKRQLIERFANPEIRDTLARLCAYSSDRIPKWLVPVIRHQLSTGGSTRFSALVVASWARYAEGIDESGESIEVVDRRRDQIMERASRQQNEPLAFLEDEDLFGDLRESEEFTAHYLEALNSLHTNGARATLETWLT